MKILTPALISAATLYLTIFPAQAAATWKCTRATWTDGPAMRSGNFVGTQRGQCALELDRDGSIARLDDHFLKSIQSSTRVHAGPVQQSYAGLPGVFYDVSVEYTQGTSMTIRQEARLATDRLQRLVYSTRSKTIAAAGMAAYLRVLNVEIQVTQGASPRQFDIILINAIAVDRPWYAPSPIFFSKARDTAVQQYAKVLEQMLGELAASL